jgi:hypothetical protein
MGEIVDRLRAGAAERGIPFWTPAAIVLVNVAISRALNRISRAAD